MTKNPDLCERAYCRERWQWQVGAFDRRAKRSWLLQVCDTHAEPYQPPHNDPIRAVTVTRRNSA